LFPSTPTECFEMTADCFDLADRFQTPVIMVSDLDLGMNFHMTPPLQWDDERRYDLGKVYNAEDLEKIQKFGRYLDVDNDGICYRTIPGTHPTKGSFFTRGTSRDEYARYTESGEVYVRVVNRLLKKWKTAEQYVPAPQLYQKNYRSRKGILFFGTTTYAALEAMDMLNEANIAVDAIRIKALPFNETVVAFLDQHDEVFVIEQNRDAQLRTIIMNELDTPPDKLISVLNYDGMPITAQTIVNAIRQHLIIAQRA
ncbi:MAG: 2-oxoacid:acceptor oxidoreductase subunit alpha, partial [Bacteroidota bacterium]